MVTSLDHGSTRDRTKSGHFTCSRERTDHVLPTLREGFLTASEPSATLPTPSPTVSATAGGSGMTCPQCQQDNPPQARFCLRCGGGLAKACTRCGTELPAEAQFCFACGQVAAAPRFGSPDSYTPKHLAERILTSKAALEGEHKQVTVLFA